MAFLVGYRERHFRNLIKRLGDAVFTSAEDRKPPTLTGLSAPKGAIAGGTPVTITGTEFVDVESVNFGDLPVKFKVVSSQQIDVPASPPAKGGVPGAVPVIVKTSGGTAGGHLFEYT